MVTGVTCSAAGVLKDPPLVNWKDASRTITQDRNTVVMPPRTTTPVRTGNGPSVSPISIKIQKIEGLRRPIIPQEVRNAELRDAYINRITSEHRDPMPSWSKAVGIKLANKSSADVYARCRMNLASDTVLRKSPNFMDFGLSSFNTTDELGSFFAYTTTIGSAMHGSNWLLSNHCISEDTSDRASRTKAKNHYNFKSEFKTRRNKVVYQYFGRQNDSMNQPPFDSTPLAEQRHQVIRVQSEKNCQSQCH